METIDTILQSALPTIMMPRAGEGSLPPAPPTGTRLIMANDGLYLECRKLWGNFRTRLWESPKRLPYGQCHEFDSFAKTLKHAYPIVKGLLEDAAKYASQQLEWQGYVTYENSRLQTVPVNFEASAEQVTCEAPDNVVIDLHSHHAMPPFWSSEDRRNNFRGTKIAVVVGNYDFANNAFDYLVAYCVQGFMFEFPTTMRISL